METAQEILEAVAKLPEDQRWFFLDALLEKMDDEFLAELDRRREARKNGSSTPIPWEEVRKNVFGK